jgi:hypothetical protein
VALSKGVKFLGMSIVEGLLIVATKTMANAMTQGKSADPKTNTSTLSNPDSRDKSMVQGMDELLPDDGRFTTTKKPSKLIFADDLELE